jgi:BolA protein
MNPLELPLAKLLTQKLTEKFKPAYLALENESPMHGLPVTAEKHFKVTIVSDSFQTLNRVSRHRLVHDLLVHELKEQIHALSVQAFTPTEWQTAAKTHASPECLGGGKHEKK